VDAATGAPLWNFDMLAAVWGSPLVADGKVYLGDEDGDVVVLQAGRTMKVLGEQNVGSAVYGTAVPANGVLYVMNQSQVFAIVAGGKK
jgi:outer membrane protein assembly factor BamB